VDVSNPQPWLHSRIPGAFASTLPRRFDAAASRRDAMRRAGTAAGSNLSGFPGPWACEDNLAPLHRGTEAGRTAFTGPDSSPPGRHTQAAACGTDSLLAR
jgi:hypothetical protein